MSLTAKQIVEAVKAQPGLDRTHGQLAALRRFHAAAASDFYDRALLDQLADVPVPRKDRPYDNPIVGSVLGPPPGQAKSLTASDVAWLQRLPADPAQVSYKDARSVSRLAAQVQSGTGDARLIASVLEPLRRLHDGRAAAVEVRNLARYTSPAPPSGPHGAAALLAAAIRGEAPDLNEDEALVRAHEALRAAVEERDAAHADAIEAAKEKVTAAEKPWNAADVARSSHYRALATAAARSGDHDAAAALGEEKAAMRELHEATFGGDAA